MCECGKELQNMDQPKNIEEESLEKASPLTVLNLHELGLIIYSV